MFAVAKGSQQPLPPPSLLPFTLEGPRLCLPPCPCAHGRERLAPLWGSHHRLEASALPAGWRLRVARAASWAGEPAPLPLRLLSWLVILSREESFPPSLLLSLSSGPCST